MAPTLEGISGFDVVCHFLVEFADPAFLFGSHFVLVVLNEGDIFGVLYLAPFSIICTRDILLLLFWSAIVLLALFCEAGWFKFFTVFHFGLEMIINLRNVAQLIRH